MPDPLRLHGRRVLIVEDNLFAAMELEQAVVALGAEPVGPVASVEQALTLARRERLDAALLDVDLRGERVFPVADELEQRGVPLAFASGYDEGAVFPERFLRHRRLPKPYDEHEVRRLLGRLIDGA